VSGVGELLHRGACRTDFVGHDRGELPVGVERVEQHDRCAGVDVVGDMDFLMVHLRVHDAVHLVLEEGVELALLQAAVPATVDEQEHPAALVRCILRPEDHLAGIGCARDLIPHESEKVGTLVPQGACEPVGRVAESGRDLADVLPCPGADAGLMRLAEGVRDGRDGYAGSLRDVADADLAHCLPSCSNRFGCRASECVANRFVLSRASSATERGLEVLPAGTGPVTSRPGREGLRGAAKRAAGILALTAGLSPS
jgi:hypothetical protein